jgi:hypothetical protein
MANGFGLRLVGRVGGGQPKVREYYVPATNAVALAEGDVVSLPASGALDPAGQVQVVVAFASAGVPLGVVQGIRPIAALPYTTGLPASTAAYIEVCDDADAIYEVQEDAVGGDVTAAQIGSMFNAALIVSTPVLGQSSTMLRSSTANSATAINDVKIIGVRRDAQNAQGIAGGAILLVKLLGPVIPGPALQSTVSHL